MAEAITAKSLVGKKYKIHGGKIPAVVIDAPSNLSVRLDYDGFLIPDDKRSRVQGRKLVPIEAFEHPERIVAGMFREDGNENPKIRTTNGQKKAP